MDEKIPLINEIVTWTQSYDILFYLYTCSENKFIFQSRRHFIYDQLR